MLAERWPGVCSGNGAKGGIACLRTVCLLKKEDVGFCVAVGTVDGVFLRKNVGKMMLLICLTIFYFFSRNLFSENHKKQLSCQLR